MSQEHRQLEVVQDGDVTIVRVKEEPGTTTFEDIIDELLVLVDEQGCRKMVVNLGSVQYLQSLALGGFVKLEKRLIELQGKLRICNLQPTVRELFELTGLQKVLDIYHDQAAATESF